MRMRLNGAFFLTLVAGLVTLTGTPIQAAPQQGATAEVIGALRAEIQALNERLAKLEERDTVAESTYHAPQPAAQTAAPSEWFDKIKLKGDIRYRHEGFNVEDSRERHRHRVRARTELQAKINDALSVGVGMATGGSDPVSTNQSLDDGASSKGLMLDLAYLKWKSPVEGLTVTAGKFKNPFHRAGGNGLVWDGDLRPEGVAATFENGSFFLNTAGLWVDESSSDDDSYMLGAQAGIETGVGEGKLIAGLSYFNYVDSRGESPFFDGESRGNLLDPDGNYLSAFQLLEGFTEYSFAFEDAKVTLFADYVQNLDADDYENAWALGVKMSQNKWKAGWTYQELEADSVLGTFSDSDFIGGGTDGEGHILKAGYALTSKVSLNGTLFLNERGVDFGDGDDYRRLQLDISIKY